MRINFLSTMRLLAFALYAALLTSCWKTIPPEYKAFLDLSRDAQLGRMRRMPIDKQIDYYFAGQEYVHPPLSLDDTIAERGKEAIPFILKRLKEEEKDYRKVFLLYTLRRMHDFHYDLRGEKEAIETLQGVTAKMESRMHKEVAEGIVKDIVENRPPDLERFKRERPHIFTNANHQ